MSQYLPCISRFLRQKKSDFHSEQSERAIAVDNKPPNPTNDMPIIVQVTSVVTPFHFWAQILPHDISPGDIEMNDEVQDPLSALTRKMDAMYRIQGYRECKYYPAIGEIVAVKSRCDVVYTLDSVLTILTTSSYHTPYI